MKNLGKYVIPEMFKDNEGNLHNLDISDILKDFHEFIDSKVEEKIGIKLDWGFSWVKEDDIIDLELEHFNEFRGCVGNFYITWNMITGNFMSIWYSGQRVDDDDEQENWKWE